MKYAHMGHDVMVARNVFMQQAITGASQHLTRVKVRVLVEDIRENYADFTREVGIAASIYP